MGPNVLTWTIVLLGVGWLVFVVLYGGERGWGAGITIGLGFGGFILAIVAYALLDRARKRRRREQVPQVAASLGLMPLPPDQAGLPALPFDLMSRGLGRTSENVMSGGVGGDRVWVFDYTYYTESHNSDGGTSRHDHYFSCAVIELPAAGLPPTRVSREGFFSKIARGIGIEDVEVGVPEFDRRFKIKAASPDHARELLDPGVQQWLMMLPEEINFEVEDRLLLAYSKQRPLDEVRPLLDAVTSLRMQLPRGVLDRYGVPERDAGT